MIELHVNDIEIGGRRRPLSKDAVERLAASLASVGLMQPITVRVVDEMVLDGQVTSGVPVLVAGHHRLEAAKSLGWSHIDCIEIEDDAVTSELCEIAENLHRLDLTKEQRDDHIRRYAELLEARKTLVTQTAAPVLSDGRKSGPQHSKGVPRQIAEETGLSVDTVRRALNPPEPKSAMPDYDVVTVQYNALMAAWNRAGPEARQRFIEDVDGPVFDSTRSGQ